MNLNAQPNQIEDLKPTVYFSKKTLAALCSLLIPQHKRHEPMTTDYLTLVGLPDRTGHISFHDGLAINKRLLDLKADQLSLDEQRNVAEYLSLSLTCGNVEQEHIEPLDALLEALEERT